MRLLRGKLPALLLLGILLLPIIYILRHAVPPFLFLCVYLFAAGIVFSTTRKGVWRAIIYNSSFLFLALGLFEGYLFIADPQRRGGDAFTWTGSYMDGEFFAKPGAIDPTMGYGLQPKARSYQSIKKRNDGALAYDAIYSVDEFGMRKNAVSPQKDCVIYLFGDSFTFGIGVNDTETLPNQFSKQSGCKTLNFGVPGYGPHHMLRLLEIDRARTIAAPKPDMVIFTALIEHVSRAAGNTVGWDDYGPLYRIVAGQAKFSGPFHVRNLNPPTVLERIKWNIFFWCKTCSLVQQRIREKQYATVLDSDNDRAIAIISKAQQIITQRYHVPFVLILWDVLPYGTKRDADFLEDGLQKKGVKVIRLSKALPELADRKYYIPLDAHPLGEAYARVTKEVLRRLPKDLLEAKPGSAPPR